MKYKISHNTTYEYGQTVPICQNEVYLTPHHDAVQSCSYHRLNVRPTPASIRKRIDYFGNAVSHFAITQGHRKLSVTATSTVEVRRHTPADLSDSPKWEDVRDSLPLNLSRQGLDIYQYCFASPHIPRLSELAEYARTCFTSRRPILEALRDLTAKVNSDFTYDPTATTVSTPVHEVFEQRRGVCQDLAHVQIGCLRSIGLAARYVSGYLRTVPPQGQPRLTGADASHAWLSVNCGVRGWIDTDPTNDCFTATDHITVACGRDYGDVCPISGMFVGGGDHTMRVAVDVVPLDEAS